MSFLNRLSIKTKLYLIVGLSAASLALAIGLAADSMRARLVEERVAKLRSIDEVAVGLAASLEQRAAAGEISHGEAIDRFRKDLHEMRYDGQAGYLVAFDMTGKTLVHTADPAQEGTNQLGDKDANGHPIVGSMIDLLAHWGRFSLLRRGKQCEL